MIEKDLAKVSTIGQMVTEVNLAPQGDMSTELMPPVESHPYGLSQGLTG